ncbi:MAG: N-acetylglucosamine-6-phosphate deacetylase [Chloroflexi bacterium]|nr:N-acetylglucosamine-6-phosphate deacetylase [Chloroflexota bacterium]
MKAVLNGPIYTPTRIIARGGAVLVEGGRIVDVGTLDRLGLPAEVERIDAHGGLICPGYVDIHVHGGDGADSTDGTVDAVRAVGRRLARVGTTSYLPTTASAPFPELWRAFDAIGEVMAAPGPGEAHALGIHMEGPLFSLEQAGAHNRDLLRMPTPAERERLLGYSDRLARVTLAPEREGAMDLIRDLSARGVLVCGGHSDALYAQVCEAMQAGLRHITHLWSSMSMLRRIGPKRYSGMLEAALVEDGLTAEIIADGYHLPSSLMKMAYRMKGAERLALVSDAMRASGLGPGVYDLAGIQAIVEEGSGVAVTEDRAAFAGSISTVALCVQQVVQVVGFPLVDALRMATETPARIIGAQQRVGRLAPGLAADLVVLDPTTLLPRAVMLGGELLAQDAA